MRNSDQKKYIEGDMVYSSFDLKNYAFKIKNNELPEIELYTSVNQKNAMTITKKTAYFVPDFVPLPAFDNQDTIRNFPVDFSFGRTEIDSLTFLLPKTLVLDEKPDDVSIDNEFGSYLRKTVAEGNQILVIRKLAIKKNTYSPSKYREIQNFFNQINDYDQQGFIFSRN